jgi:hypothetical protein
MARKPKKGSPADPESQAERGDPAQSLPDSLTPAVDKNAPDGGTAQHPLHDDDLEDRDPEDFEHDIEDVGETEPLDVVLRRQG